MKRELFVTAVLCCLLQSFGGNCARSANTGTSPILSNDMSNQRVNAFAEDSHGHIWIGTFRGLNRYNGHEYQQYFCENGDSLTIPDNQIKCLLLDSKERLWVSTVNGIAQYLDKGCFSRVRADKDAGGNNAIQLIEDGYGRIIGNCHWKIQCYDEATNTMKDVIYFNDAAPSVIRRCHISPSKDLTVVCSSEIRRYDGGSFALKDFIPVEYGIISSCSAGDGTIWLSCTDGIRIFDPDNFRFRETPFSIKEHISLIHTYGHRGMLLYGSACGFYFYDRPGGKLIHQSDSDFPFTAPDVAVNCLYIDSNDNLWIGSYDQAYTVVYNYVERFNTDNWLKNSLSHKSVTAMSCDPEDNVWMSTLRDGIFLYNPHRRELKKVSIPDKPVSSEKYCIQALHAASDGRIWMAAEGYLGRFRYEGGKLVNERYWQLPYVLSIREDGIGTVWASCTDDSVFLYSGKGNGQTFRIGNWGYGFISSLLPDGDRMIAACFGEGLFRIDPKTGSAERILLDSEQWNECIQRSTFIPTDLFRDSYGKIWIGTVANGLLLYDPSEGSIRSVPGTPCTDIASIEEDLQGNIWVSTMHGLGKYDRSTERFANWFASDGTGGDQFYDRSSCRLSDGTLIFGGTHGVTRFGPIDITTRHKVPVVFENLKVHNRLVRPGKNSSIDRELPYCRHIELNNSQNSFAISFAAIDYGEYERVHYFYRLDGFDQDWIDAGNNREANYANIPAGRYNFRVKVTDTDVNTVLGENSISLHMAPPLWLSWWAILLYIAAGSAVVLLVLRFRRHYRQEKEKRLNAIREKEQEQKVNRMNMSFFANISHEFRTPLTMISGPVKQMQEDASISIENRRLLNIIQRNIRRMLGLVNQLLDFNKLENDTLPLQVKPLDIVALLRNISEIFQVSAGEKGIVFRCFGLEDSLMIWADVDKIEKIVSNLLSNAFKYTPSGGQVELSLDTDGSNAKIVVRDTGPGIPEDQMEKIFYKYYQLDNQGGTYNYGTGIGLYYARALARLHHGSLTARNRSGNGSAFTLLFPMNSGSYRDSEKCELSNTGMDAALAGTPQPVIYSEMPESLKDAGACRKKVLVVDDDADVIHYMKELLSARYDVNCRFDANSAYKSMKEEAPDIVVSDVVMTGGSGYELCRRIREDIQLSHIPVILLTAKANVQDQVEGLDSGADAYVTKPFEPKYLLALIASLLKNREKLHVMLGNSTAVTQFDSGALLPQDSSFMEELYKLMENELSNTELDVTRMTELLHISRTKLYYKVKGLTGENPSVFFKRYKLNRAAELLREHKYTISEIADMTGFSTLSHFSTSFKKQFGMTPGDYAQQ